MILNVWGARVRATATHFGSDTPKSRDASSAQETWQARLSIVSFASGSQDIELNRLRVNVDLQDDFSLNQSLSFISSTALKLWISRLRITRWIC